MIAPPTAIFQSQQTTREFGLRRSSATISIDTRPIKSGRLFALKNATALYNNLLI
jgi:hypothetical protein